LRRVLAIALVCSACSEVGVTLDVSAAADVPTLDALRVQATQGDVLVAQVYLLQGRSLPQSIALVSGGMTRGTVDIVVQGLKGSTVEALGTATAELQSSRSKPHVAVVLERRCDAMGSCDCLPLECAASGTCGRLDDGCGGQRDCGSCGAGESCAANRCVTSGCVPRSCADAGVRCGPASDGCNGTLDCGLCDAGACVPRTCADAGADCGEILDGCGGAVACGSCDAGTCGGGGLNRCGSGTCTPRQACDAGLTCGELSDGCSALRSCGTCDAGMSCSANVCTCAPLTACPAGKTCGALPNGCGGMINCGTCDAGTCQSNQCCRPLTVCPPGACSTVPDGCGGKLDCTQTCPSGTMCMGQKPDAGSFDICSCAPPTAACNGVCVDVSSDQSNCGACGHTCPGGHGCHQGVCPCPDVASNADGHCCPPGWTFASDFDGIGLHCYLGPRGAGTLTAAMAACRQSAIDGYGMALTDLGVGASPIVSTAVPTGACGAYWTGGGSLSVVLAGPAGVLGAVPQCDSNCTHPACTCSTCSCQSNQIGCTQSAWCVMDPLAPTMDGPCAANSDCPPGLRCASGACTDGGRACSIGADCGPVGPSCTWRGGNGVTGLCQ
jgi:hypothetical protein